MTAGRPDAEAELLTFLARAFIIYGEHRAGCAYAEHAAQYPCDCGYSEALMKASNASESDRG